MRVRQEDAPGSISSPLSTTNVAILSKVLNFRVTLNVLIQKTRLVIALISSGWL